MRLRTFLLALLSPLIVWPAGGQTPQETWKMCFGPTTARTIAACTTIIDARGADADKRFKHFWRLDL